jgi:hypothetical protein
MDAVPRARFFEQFYLKNNPDVAEAVAAGDFSASNFSRFQKLP